MLITIWDYGFLAKPMPGEWLEAKLDEGSLSNVCSSSLSDLKNRSDNSTWRGQILKVLQVNNPSIDQKSGEI